MNPEKLSVVSKDGFLAWVVMAHTLRTLQLDFLIEECTTDSGHLVQPLLNFLGSGWDELTQTLCPAQLGHPSTRKRRWTTYRNHKSNTWSGDVQPALSLHQRSVQMEGIVYWCAPPEMVIQRLQQKRLQWLQRGAR